MRILYIDPGYRGAAILFIDDKPVEAYCFTKEGKNIDVIAFESVLWSLSPDKIYLEHIGPRPGQHASSTFYQGLAYGSTLTMCQINCRSVELIWPQTWTSFTKRLSTDPKRTSKEIAQELTRKFYPKFAEIYKSKRAKKFHDGIADALCIQIYVNRDQYLQYLS